MKFIHTSDWHLGRQFHGVSLLEDQRLALSQIIQYCEQERVDALLIAGDIYDRAVPPAAAIELLDETLTRLCDDLGITVIAISGNHDSATRLSFGSRQLQRAGLHICGDLTECGKPIVLSSGDRIVHVYAMPFFEPASVRDAFGDEVSSYDEAHRRLLQEITPFSDAADARILVSHCFISGGVESESERPLTIGGTDSVSYEPLSEFDYVALGHLHTPQYRGAPHIRYSGSLLKYSFSEMGTGKAVTLVELTDSGSPLIRQLPLQPRRELRMLEGPLNELLAAASGDSRREDYLQIRLTDTHALLNPMAKLREYYPNILLLEKTGLQAAEMQPVSRDALRRQDIDIFRDFFEQVTGQPLNDAQDSAARDLIESLQTRQESQ